MNEILKLGLSKDKQIIVYCWDNMCSLGYTSASKLLNAEYSNVKELLGGIAAWKSRNLPLINLKTEGSE